MQKGKVVALAMAAFLVIGCVAPLVAPVMVREEAETSVMTTPYVPELTPEPTETELKRYDWDLDGDGTEETLSFTFLDNGDEAPSMILIETRVGDVYASLPLEGGYRVTAAKGQEDGSVILAYAYGDFYSHDRIEAARIRYADGELTVG